MTDAHMPGAPLVSIAMAAHDAARYLRPALQSVLRQTHRPLEVIVWDDGSTDATPRILERVAPRFEARGIAFAIGRHPGGAHLGIPATKNAAVFAARGEFVQILDADDVLPAGAVARRTARLRADDALDAVYGRAFRFTRFPRAPWTLPWWTLECPDLLAELCHLNPFPPHAVLFRRRLFERLGGFDPALPLVGDHDFWFRAVASGARFAPLRGGTGDLVPYRWHAANVSHARPSAARCDLIVRRRVAAWAHERGRGWHLWGAAWGLLASARELAGLGVGFERGAAEAAAEARAVLRRLEDVPPDDWREGWEKTWTVLIQDLFRTPGVGDDARVRFARWAARLGSPRAFRSRRARLAAWALARFAEAPSSRWPRALLERAAHFRTLGIAAALRAGGPGWLALEALAAAPADARAALERLRRRISLPW